MKRNLILFGLTLFIGLSASAQRSTTIRDADWSFIKDEKKINMIFDYEGMTVGKNMTEEDYVAEKVAEKNEKKKGTGDEWKESWEKGKLNIYEPMFKKAFDKKLAKVGLVASEGDDARITVIVRTTRMEPGFNIGITKMPAVADFEIFFVETANHDNVIAQMVATKITGSDTYAVSDRVKICYMGLGSQMGGYIAKYIKKANK